MSSPIYNGSSAGNRRGPGSRWGSNGTAATAPCRWRASVCQGRAASSGSGSVPATRDFDIDLPFEIDFESRDIGGPSAGFVYALAIADMLDPGDYADGRTIAATGSIDIEGTVGEIGHPDLKAVAAEEEGADVFLVPQSQVDEVEGVDLEVIGVENLEQAIDLLEGPA